MDQAEVRAFVETFFTLRECSFLERTEHSLVVKINESTDRDLGNRPFYWTYIDQMGMEPQLQTLNLIFDETISPKEAKGELIQFGSQRLHQIFKATRERGQFVRLYEDRQLQKGTNPLYPWILLNYKIKYICDQKKERLCSYGFNLVTGEVWPNFYDVVQRLSLTPTLPAYLFIQRPLFEIEVGLEKIEQLIEQDLKREDQTWAHEALKRYNEEKAQSLQYYDEMMKKVEESRHKKQDKNGGHKLQREWDEERRLRLEELAWQYKPRIEVQTINQGIFYLRTHPSRVSLHSPLPSLYF